MIVFYEDDRGTDPVELKEIRGLFEAALETLASTGTLVRDVNGKAYCDVRKKHVSGLRFVADFMASMQAKNID